MTTDTSTTTAISTTTAFSTTTSSFSNTTHIYDTYDVFIHPHWKQFPLIPDAWHYAIGVFMTFAGIGGVLGNLLVIYIFGTTKHLRTPSNMFVVNLAFSDLTFSAVMGFPLFSISAFSKRWIFGKIACELYGLTGGVFGLMSMNTMAAIAVDRYNVIARPIKASRSLSYRKAFMMIVAVWVWSITWTIPPLFGWGAYIPEGFQTSCTFDYLTRNDYFRSFILCLYLCGFATPLSIILFCYYFIYRAVASHEREMGKMAKKLNAEIRQGQSAQHADIKTAKIAMTIIMAYLLSWTPYASVALIAQFGPAEYVTPYVSELPVVFAKASAMHNPIIYALSHPKFREVLNTRFPWLLCCCRVSAKEKEAASATDNRSRMSRMDSINSNAPGGTVSNMSSEMSNISDSGYTHNIGEAENNRHVSMKLKNVRETTAATATQDAENNGALIRDILQAFVGVVNAQGSRQVPVYIPPQYFSQFAAPANVGQPLPPQQAVYSISQGAVPTETLPNPPPLPPQPLATSLSTPSKVVERAKDVVPPPPPPAAASGTIITTTADVTPHVNEGFQEE